MTVSLKTEKQAKVSAISCVSVEQKKSVFYIPSASIIRVDVVNDSCR
jgi:hypothetical protein